MTTPRTAAGAAIADRLAGRERLLEVGIGRRTDVAALLAAAGADVTAVDVREVPVPVPAGVDVRRADVVELSRRTDPGPAYRVDAIYALNLPPELHRPTLELARTVDAAFLFTTLGFDEPAVPVERESIGGGTSTAAAGDAATDDAATGDAEVRGVEGSDAEASAVPGGAGRETLYVARR